jgi:hypothetical protein
LAEQWLIMAWDCIASTIDLVYSNQLMDHIEASDVNIPPPASIPNDLWSILKTQMVRAPSLHMKHNTYI